MSYAPQTLLDARAYILARTKLKPVQVGIVGDSSHTYGYHLGKDRLPPNDYSARTARDRAGLSNAASALDIGDFGGLWRLTEFLVAEARAGRLPDVREIIGPLRDGRAYRWDHLDGWTAVRQPKGNSHEWHLHISYYRDSEHRDKTAPFGSFFEGDGGGGEMGDDMPLSDEEIRSVANETRRQVWGFTHERYSPNKDTYSHLRLQSKALERVEAKLDALLAAQSGQDVIASVKATLDEHDRNVTEALADIAALVGQVGTVPAERIVDEIARRLGEGG